jgi:chromosome segregation ATPase
MVELRQQRQKEADLKRKIDELENQLHSAEEENALLRNFNTLFGDENEKLFKENEMLKTEVSKYEKYRIPKGLQQDTRPKRRVISRKRSKFCPSSPEESPDEEDAIKARVSTSKFYGRIFT